MYVCICIWLHRFQSIDIYTHTHFYPCYLIGQLQCANACIYEAAALIAGGPQKQFHILQAIPMWPVMDLFWCTSVVCSPHIHTHTYIDIYIFTYCTYIHTCIHTYIHTHIITYIHTLGYIHIHIHTCIYAYMCIYIYAYVFTHSFLHTYTSIYIYVYIQTAL